jgi:hypothetical protein
MTTAQVRALTTLAEFRQHGITGVVQHFAVVSFDRGREGVEVGA